MFTGKKDIYVLDTNVLVDYPELIPAPGEPGYEPENPTVDLSQAHIVIPTAVTRELTSFKNERNERGKAARVVLKRLRKLLKAHTPKMSKVYSFEEETHIVHGDQIFSIYPVHSDFKKCLPFRPDENDMDGQIILATMAIAFAKAGVPVDGTATKEQVDSVDTGTVELLTNDNGMAIRAYPRGVITGYYAHKYPDPYTGRREVVVTKEIFFEFYNSKKVTREMFEEAMPKEPRLVANEFIVMKLEDPADYPRGFAEKPYFEHVGRYDVFEDAIVNLKYASSFPVRPKNVGQAIYAEALMNPQFSAVVCTGPAGSGKTFMATVYGYTASVAGQYIGVTVVPCESHGKLGALPGDMDEKMDPQVQPFKNALRNYLLREDPTLRKELELHKKFGASGKKGYDGADDSSSGGNYDAKRRGGKTKDHEKEREDIPQTSGKRSLKEKADDRVELIWGNWFTNIPIENARGRDFAYELALYDEFQDQNVSQANTLITRIGEEGKIIITGDVQQIHVPYLDVNNNGLVYASAMYYDNPYVAQVCFNESEVVRHPLVAMVAQRQKERKRKDEILDETLVGEPQSEIALEES